MILDITFVVYLPSTTPRPRLEFLIFEPAGDYFFVLLCVWADYDFYISRIGPGVALPLLDTCRSGQQGDGVE
jgi:hypothetical protein